MNLAFLNLIVVHCLHALALFFLVDWRFHARTMIFVWTAYVVVSSAISIALLMFVPISITAVLTFVFAVGAHFAICMYAGNGSAGKNCFLVASYLIFFYCVVIVADWLSLLFKHYAPLAEIILKIPFFAAAIALWLCRGKNGIKKISGAITYGWKMLAFFAVFIMLGTAVVTNSVFPPMRADFTRLNIVGTLAFMLVVVTSYAVLLQTIYAMNEKFDAMQLRSMKLLLESELSAEQQYVELAKQYRHDARHHSRLLLSLAQSGDLEKICAYLSDYDSALEKSALVSFSKHTVVNALLSGFSRKAAESGVSCKIQCEIPEKLPLSDVEICSLLGNLLENALEASRRCTDAHISFFAFVKDGDLCITAHNSVSGTVTFKDGLPVTTKRDGGTGTRSMTDTIFRHGGLAEFSQEGQDFVVKIVIPM